MNKKFVFMMLFVSSFTIFACAPRSAPVEKPSFPGTGALQVQAVGKEAWELEWEQLKIEARKEGKIVVGSSAGSETREALAGPLKKKFGLELEWFSSPAGVLIAKINAERNAGLHLFDMIITGPDTPYSSLRPRGIIIPLYEWLLLPEVKNPEAWISGKVLFYDEEHTILNMTATPTGKLLINTSLVDTTEVKSLRDLLNPKWKGKIVMHLPIGGGSGRRWATEYADVLGFDFHRQLVKQDLVLTDNHRLGAEWVARGKYSIGIAIRSEDVTPFIRLGAPVSWVFPSEGAYLSASGGYVMVLDQAPHPKAAKLFLNWLLSREGQILWSKVSTDHTARVDIKAEELEIPDINKRQPGVKYYYTLSREYSSTRHVKEITEIFGPLMK